MDNKIPKDTDWCTGFIRCDICGSEALSVYPCHLTQLECPTCGIFTSYTPEEDWDNDDDGDVYA